MRLAALVGIAGAFLGAASSSATSPAPLSSNDWTIVETLHNTSQCTSTTSKVDGNGALSFLTFSRRLFETGCFRDRLYGSYFADFNSTCKDSQTILTVVHQPEAVGSPLVTCAGVQHTAATVTDAMCVSSSGLYQSRQGQRPSSSASPGHSYTCVPTAALRARFSATGVLRIASIGHANRNCDEALAERPPGAGFAIPLDGSCVQRVASSSRASCDPETGEVLWADYSGTSCAGAPVWTVIATLVPRCFVMPSFSATGSYLGTVEHFECGASASQGDEEGSPSDPAPDQGSGGGGGGDQGGADPGSGAGPEDTGAMASAAQKLPTQTAALSTTLSLLVAVWAVAG